VAAPIGPRHTTDRGLLRGGFKADVVFFDAKTVQAPATRSQPKQLPIGIDYVIVNGQVVVDGLVLQREGRGSPIHVVWVSRGGRHRRRCW
jgi:N-acyl-D-aspartate/D-glutamate deacylase